MRLLVGFAVSSAILLTGIPNSFAQRLAGKSVFMTGLQIVKHCDGSRCKNQQPYKFTLKRYIGKSGKIIFDYGRGSVSGDLFKVGVKHKSGAVYQLKGNVMSFTVPSDNSTYILTTRVTGKTCSSSAKIKHHPNGKTRNRKSTVRLQSLRCKVSVGNAFK